MRGCRGVARAMLPPMKPLITAELPGCGGRCGPKDHSADEVLAKQPARTGDHWWIKVGKSGLGTQQARAAIARAVACDVEHVSCAGHRDRQGNSIQWFSVPAEVVEHPGPLRRAGAHGKMRVLELTSSHKPVTPETVSALRWTCRIRGGNQGEGYQQGRAVLDVLRRKGCPNWMPATQVDEDLVRLGRLLLDGKRLPPQAVARHVDPSRCRRACQGWLFDRWLEARVADGLMDRCIAGDRIHTRAGDEVLVTDVAAAQRRLDSFEAVVMGPLFGEDMTPVEGEARAREEAVLAAAGLDAAHCASLPGGRRSARVQPGKVLLDIEGADLLLICELPVEAAIDGILAELLKPSDNVPPVVEAE